ncbi:MAG TPA: hypothetical protein VFY68_14400 [Nitrososphaeraceae archaeon]|nr:hypothetical protein [Nitrososphaeraceae archaeon]
MLRADVILENTKPERNDKVVTKGVYGATKTFFFILHYHLV